MTLYVKNIKTFPTQPLGAMLKKMRKYWTIIAIVLTLFGCQNETKTDKAIFLLDLPDTSKTHQPDIFYEVKNKAVDELNLNRLENGVDSFELRLWTKVEVTNGGQVLIIKKINDNWTCLDYSYLESQQDFKEGQNIIDHMTSFTIDTFWVKKKQPHTDWITFLSEIEKEKIYELPAQTEIDGWENRVSDGYTYYIEFANKDKYKFYWYNCPDIYEEEFAECQHMTNILGIFNTEFGLKMGSSYRCRN